MSAILKSLRNLAGSSRPSAAGENSARFGVTAGEGEGGFTEWLHAMRLVARLPAGVPQHFRKKLWLSLAERHLTARGVEWSSAERACFRGTAQPDDTELGAQILKDLHRTGCSLFCGTEGRENQAMLRRVLLAYARWNKEVGYCQGFNMIAAIILEVMDKSESDSLKVMIYLVEAVLPEGYFADDLRGLSADMAAFRDLLRLRLPRLANHMDHLQQISDGGGVEPPLPDVFTMQWFLTLYATWLPRDCLLRIWDLVLLDGNELLLLTALGIWDILEDRILAARSADEFYSCMGGGASAVWEAGDSLVARVVAFGSAPELPRLRNLHRYRVTPPAPPAAPTVQAPMHSAMQSMTKRGLRLFYSEDEGESSDDGNKMALATVIPRREQRTGTGDRLTLDIGALKRQYARLRERQRQAHVILAAACARHAAVGVPTSPTSLTVNNLLLGKSAIISSRGRRLGPPPGAVPPTRQTASPKQRSESRSRARSNETISWNEEKSRKTLSRRNSVKWKDIKKDKTRKASIDFDEAGDGVIVSEREANEMLASLRQRSRSESSSYSSHSGSSTDTSLCDENEAGSDTEPDLPLDRESKISKSAKSKRSKSPALESTIILPSPIIAEPTISPTSVPVLVPVPETKQETPEKSIKNINEFLDTAAGEQLRTYIDGFETKFKTNSNISCESESYEAKSPYKEASKYSPLKNIERNNVLDRLSNSACEETVKINENNRPTKLSRTLRNFTELSPIDLSCSAYDFDRTSPFDYDFETNFRRPSPNIISCSRTPDIIDSLTKYPNFVPDIDLSDKNVSDLDSPPRSPGAESVIVSEDEPPIPLKIDKYFEHSPEFFGARVTDANNLEIPNRRAPKRNSRIPKKPDSLTLKSRHSEKIPKEELERASSLPHSNSFSKSISSPAVTKSTEMLMQPREEKCEEVLVKPIAKQVTPEKLIKDSFSPKEYMLRSGRKNSERALQIIQENSKILSRILTKQNLPTTDDSSDTNRHNIESNKCASDKPVSQHVIEKIIESQSPIDSPILKESTSDTLIGYRKRDSKDNSAEINENTRIRPLSIDDPFCYEIRETSRPNEKATKYLKSPISEALVNKTDLYGWENKGFLAKCDFKSVDNKIENNYDEDYVKKYCDKITHNTHSVMITSEWSSHSVSIESKTSVTLPSSEVKDSSTYEKRLTSDDYNNYPLSSKYNDFILSKASDICSKTSDQGPKVCENILKTDNSQVSDFAHIVTSSISFTCDPSAEDYSPTGLKSNSSDTLCQITSLDQVSTPISPKTFPPRDTPSLSKECEKTKVESDDTCSVITPLVETETLSSLSYPRSPSTGSYHPFPTRPALRMPKELGVRLGMYPKDPSNP